MVKKASPKSKPSKKLTKKEKREQVQAEFKASLDTHMPNARQGIELATFAGLTTLYYYGAEPMYEKALKLGIDLDVEAPPMDWFTDINIALASFNITLGTEVLKGMFPGGVMPGLGWDDMKKAIIGVIVEEVPPGMTLDESLEGMYKKREEDSQRLRKWLAMKDPPQTKEALDGLRAIIALTESRINMVINIQRKIKIIRLMGAMGAAGLSIYFAQDYNISQLIPGE